MKFTSTVSRTRREKHSLGKKKRSTNSKRIGKFAMSLLQRHPSNREDKYFEWNAPEFCRNIPAYFELLNKTEHLLCHPPTQARASRGANYLFTYRQRYISKKVSRTSSFYLRICQRTKHFGDSLWLQKKSPTRRRNSAMKN